MKILDKSNWIERKSIFFVIQHFFFGLSRSRSENFIFSGTQNPQVMLTAYLSVNVIKIFYIILEIVETITTRNDRESHNGQTRKYPIENFTE